VHPSALNLAASELRPGALVVSIGFELKGGWIPAVSDRVGKLPFYLYVDAPSPVADSADRSSELDPPRPLAGFGRYLARGVALE
jgi:hypothetical protein